MTMDEVDLLNLQPLVQLLLLGGGIAAVFLVWILVRHRHATPAQRLQALRVLTLFLVFDLILFGAYTRLSDSGLGCPDWPGCYGHASPVGAVRHIAAAQAQMPTGPVTHGKAWVEMVHRYLATGVGALLTALTVLSWRERWRARAPAAGAEMPVSPWWPTVTLLWVCVIGAFGALTVTMKLFPAIVTLHLLSALVLLMLLCVQVVRGAQRPVAVRPMGAVQRRWLLVTLGLVLVQVALGGWVSTNYAVMACTDFPVCQGRWWPDMDFKQGFELWRHLGETGAGDTLSFAALTAIHYAHRLWAYVVLILLVVVAWWLNRSGVWRVPSRILAALTGLQLATGLGNVVLGWPLVAALMHTGGAAALVLTLTWVLASAASSDKSTGFELSGHKPKARYI